MAKEILNQELHEAIQRWRDTWKNKGVDEALKLYTENVRVMRSGQGLIVGREALKATMQRFWDLGWYDIDFISDEIAGIPSSMGEDEFTLAWQRYHEALVREDNSEISTIWGMMIWKKVSGVWLIDAYANCAVPPEQQSTQNLCKSVQCAFNQLAEAWAAHDVQKALQFYSDDCLFMVPGSECLRGKAAVTLWLEKVFAKDWSVLEISVESALPVAENYIESKLVHVTYPSLCIRDGTGKVILRGGGNAIVRSNGLSWEIREAVWNCCQSMVVGN